MNKKKFWGSLLLFALCVTMMGQPTGKREGNEVVFHSEEGDLRLQMCNEQMFRISKSKGTEFPENESWMVVKYDFDPVEFTLRTVDRHAEISTSALRITVEESPWRITVKNAEGTTLYQEIGSTTEDQGNGPSNQCLLRPDEHFFGFGERMDRLDQRGQRVHLNVELGKGVKPAVGGKDILRANYCPVPYFMSNKGYAIFFHTAYPTDWDMGWSSTDSYTYSATGGDLDYYFIAGPSIESMIHQYQTLTGNAPLMPRSAYGLHVGSYSGGTWKHEECTSDQYPIDLVHRLRKEKIPFDLLWLDSTWRIFNSRFGNGGCCFEFRDNFKHPQAMIDSIYANHVDLFGLHIRAIVDDGSSENKLFEEAVAAGATHPKASSAGIINFFDPKAVDWWWNHGVMKIASMGVKFVKTDCGGVMRFAEGTTFDSGFSAEERHNLFPIAYAKAPYEKFQEYNRQRGFNHTREGYAGIQRYPFIWAGDWGTEWQWFEPVIRGGLNIGLSGVGYWSHCMGGFEQYSPYDTDLYLRWCQFGMFSPVSILFGMDHPRYHEPWTYGEEAMATFIKYDSIRYELIPYIYSNAYRMYRTSRPLMTPLLYDYLSDERTYNLSDQFMFGTALMVCPVTTKGALSRPVYFPGGKWIDYWTGERIEGRQYKSFLTPPDLMPIFIREGAIIPKQPLMQYLSEKPVDVITLTVFPGEEESSYELYEDDGRSLDYQQGIYATTLIRAARRGAGATVTIAKTTGKYRVTKRTYRVELYAEECPTEVSLNGKVLKKLADDTVMPATEGWCYDTTLKRVLIHSDLTNEKEITIQTK